MPGTLREGGAAFPQTRWSMILLATETQSAESARTATANFCQSYWPAIYSYLRRHGHQPADAQDLTQAFLAHLLEENALARADQERGRLRSFVLGALKIFLARIREKQFAVKRGGGQQFVPLIEHLDEVEASMQTDRQADATASYDRAWALALTRRTWLQLREAYIGEGKRRFFDELEPFILAGVVAPPSPEAAAARLGIHPTTFRTSLHRLRQRYRDTLRAQVALTLNSPADVDEELRYFYRLLMG